MRKPLLGVACAFAITLSAGVLAEQSTPGWEHAIHNGLTRERVVGLVNVPELVGGGCGPEVPATIALYSAPSAEKPPIGSIEFVVAGRKAQGVSCEFARVALQRAGAPSAEAMPMEESGYEIPAAIAYERVGKWFRIALPDGSGWIRRDVEAHFLPYPELLQDQLTHLTSGWDGTLRSTAGGVSAKAMSPKLKSFLKKLKDDGGEDAAGLVDVDVLASRRVGGEMWIQVRVTDGHCGDDESVTLDTGWVPAYRATGKPSVWFYARGC
jgi:hypothetical protein